ncbi:MAG: hypothetical protein HY316_08450 [Acidobacteria bacterium]|nr:hypothetical protein [Acidobacteriota bacterium]
MSQQPSMVERAETHPGKVVYFATGTAAEVTADLQRLHLGGNGARLRLVAPADLAPQLSQLAALKPEEVLAFRPGGAALLWIRLLGFLGLSRRTAVFCLTSEQRFRFLKFLALSLRGRIVFRYTNGAGVPLHLGTLAGLWLRRRWNASEERMKGFPIGVIGSASAASFQRIIPAVRACYPGVLIHGLLPATAPASAAALFDAVRILQPGILGSLREAGWLLRRKGEYQRWIVPCTNESYALLKVWAFLWPLNRRQIYNEFGDGFPARRVRTFLWHFWWRNQRRIQSREEAIAHFPIGVVGSASGYYLEKIIPVVRARYPRAPLHGLLPSTAPAAAAALFDAVRILQPGILGSLREAGRLLRAKGEYQRWIVPCTNEPFVPLKCLAFLWPLNRRQIYNEFGDGFPARSLWTLWGHFRWRNQRRLQAREEAIARLAIGVVGSASGYYLEKIIAVIRAQFPGIKVHGLLLASAAPATAALFDSVQELAPGIWSAVRETGRLERTRRKYQRWIIPCTSEPYGLLKWMAFLWPLTRRQIYNELADGFAVRDLRTLWWHMRWRLRDHMSFQFLAGTAGRSLPGRIMHICLYALRILAAVPLLLLARLRFWRNRWLPRKAGIPAGSRRPGGTVRDEKAKTRAAQLVRNRTIASRVPSEPDGSVGLK